MALPSFVPDRPLRPWARVTGLYRGWWIAMALSVAAFAHSPFVNPVLGVFIHPLQDEFGWHRSTIAGALSLGTLAGAGITVLVGPLLDRYGARVFLCTAALVMGAALIALGSMSEIWQYYILYGVGRAFVIGVAMVSISVTIANWFIRNRGRATAIHLIGGRGGMALMPVIALVLISGFGWRAAFVTLGVMTLLLAFLPILLLVRRRPEDLGQRPDGDPPLSTPAPGAAPATALNDVRWPVREVVRTKAFWLLVFGTSQVFVVSGAVNLSMIPHFEDQGLSAGAAVSVVTVWALLGIAGGAIGSESAQRFGTRATLCASMFFTAAGLSWLIIVQDIWMAYAFAVVHGLAFGAQMPLSQLVYPEYFGRWTIGAISGITMPIQWLLGASGPFVASIAFDVRGSYDVIFGVYVGLSILGGILIFLARQPRRGEDAAPG